MGEWYETQEDGSLAHWRCAHGHEPTFEAPVAVQLELAL